MASMFPYCGSEVRFTLKVEKKYFSGQAIALSLGGNSVY